MKYMQKIAIAAIVGAVVSSLISANRKAIDRLLHTRKRHEQIEALRLWYEAELCEIDRIAEVESIAYIKDNTDYFINMMKGEELSVAAMNGYLEGIRLSARELVRLDQCVRIAKVYNIRLSDLDANLGYEQNQNVTLVMSLLNDAVLRMHDADFPIDSLTKRLYTRPRV